MKIGEDITWTTCPACRGSAYVMRCYPWPYSEPDIKWQIKCTEYDDCDYIEFMKVLRL